MGFSCLLMLNMSRVAPEAAAAAAAATHLPSRRGKTPARQFSWHGFSYLLEVLSYFLVNHCSRKWFDWFRVAIINEPLCKREFRGTLKEKVVVLTWRADDLRHPSQQRKRKKTWAAAAKPRDHQKLLKNAFPEFNLDVDQHWGEWIVRISVPEKDFCEMHQFYDKRKPVVEVLLLPTQEQPPAAELEHDLTLSSLSPLTTSSAVEEEEDE